jgi:hypothetical protein
MAPDALPSDGDFAQLQSSDAANAPARAAVDVLGGLFWSPEPGTSEDETQPWLWHGYLGRGMVTLLTSQWKSGKTTLIAVLLARLQHGGQLAGLDVAVGRAVVITEEGRGLWRERIKRLGLGKQIGFLCRPFAGKPGRDDWLTLIDGLLALHARQRLDLVVIDTLGTFLPGRNENSAGVMMECLLPLQRLTAAGMGLLLVHHPRKGDCLAGQAARGSGALSGFVDILIEMRWYSHAGDGDRRRRLRAFSRHAATPPLLLMELNAEGTDYQAQTPREEDELGNAWEALQLVLEDAVLKLTREEIQEQWPTDYPPPGQASLWRLLDRAVQQRLLCQDGRGKKREPFRYWLPAREAMLRPEPGASQAEMQAWNDRVMLEFLEKPRT